MKRKQRSFCPVWAETIEVKREGETLLVRGWGQLLHHVDVPQNPDHKALATFNLIDQFRRYALQQLSKKSTESKAGIYQFADATDDDKLVAFVHTFGPVWGTIRESQADTLFHMQTVTVAQEMATLRSAQRIFAAATKLLAEINRNGSSDAEMIAEALMTIDPAPSFVLPERTTLPDPIQKLVAPNRPGTVDGYSGDVYQWTWSMLAVHALMSGDPDKRRLVTQYAHHGLCQLLNRFPPHLFPADGRQPIELPPIRKEGILGAIYYKLRLDYLAQRQIGICQNCGGHFSLLRRGAIACGDICSRAIRNRKYWSKSKKPINRKRRKQTRRSNRKGNRL